MKQFTILVCLLLGISGCHDLNDQEPKSLSNLADNPDVAAYMEQFEGRGALSDQSAKPSPQKSLRQFRTSDDLQVDLVLSEPKINQPVEINFDHRGRLWVVQYEQYPYPQGLKVTGIDHHIRMTFDKKPLPPPVGVKGADKITFFEDTNGDGIYDRSTDAITGLNIATGVTWGRGKIWVLNPPYLLAYPDPDGDGLPDGDPVVHIDGFGLEDTHAVANSLRWGPDGWLYGAQGSTTTAIINTAATKDLRFEGQVIWRYHPKSMVFEIYAEGGGNTFHVEIDAKGRIYSGTNGTTRGQYYKQGAYYTKNWGKHGALTNPYSFGYLPDMNFHGDKIRFTHAWIKYEGAALPSAYHNKMLAINPLHNYVQMTRMEANGSTFTTHDEGRILETEDKWFRPVDIKVGPDGAVYFADWCDSRLSHVDPRDTWHRNSGRIYRLQGRSGQPAVHGDLSQMSTDSLILLLQDSNKWYRQQALRQLGDRRETSAVPSLTRLLSTADDQTALEALWAINLSGGWNDLIAQQGYKHKDPFVRMWAVRLSGDSGDISPALARSLIDLSNLEEHPEVISQIAATAKRLPASSALPIFKSLTEKIDNADPDNPLMLWWALEAHVDDHQSDVAELFGDLSVWQQPVVRSVILERLMQRLMMTGQVEDYKLATQLFQKAPNKVYGKVLMNGFLKGMRGRDLSFLPADLLAAMTPFQSNREGGALAMDMRRADPEAIAKVVKIIADPDHPLPEKLTYIRIMGEISLPGTVDALLNVVESRKSDAVLIKSALSSLASYSLDEIGDRILKDYPDHLRADPEIRDASLYTLASRLSWAEKLIDHIRVQKDIHASDVSRGIVYQMKWLGVGQLHRATEEIWPNLSLATSAEKKHEIERIVRLMQKQKGSFKEGQKFFQILCANCHQLFGQGGTIGPDLTGYDRKNIPYLAMQIVDPNADIREGFVTHGLYAKDDRFFSGIIKDRSLKEVTIQPIVGEDIALNIEQIDSLVAKPVSIMPERLTSNLSDQQLQDLFTYLMGPEAL